MSFVGPPYTHDIFISYSHGTDGSGEDSYFKQWSRCFWKTLEKNLKAYQKLRGFTLFFDESPGRGLGIDNTINLDRQIETFVRGSATFVPLLSHRYFGSTWCQRELEMWCDEQQRKGRLTEGRLIPIQIWGEPPDTLWERDPARKNTWPEVLADTVFSGLIGFDFYSAAEMLKGLPQPYGWPAPNDQIVDHDFHRVVKEVSGRLSLNLESIKSNMVALQPAAGRSREIYLSGSRASVEIWKDARRKLREEGFIIYPETHVPDEPDDAERNKLLDDQIEQMSLSDAVMAVVPDDPRDFRSELRFLTEQARPAAIGEAEKRLKAPAKPLPIAILDPVADSDRAEQRQANAVNAKLGWFNYHSPDWVHRASAWLNRPA